MTKFIQDRLTPLLVLGYQILALICFLAMPFWAYDWLNTPFMGGFVEHSLMVNSVSPTRPGTWALNNLNLSFGHQVVSIAGEPVRTAAQIQQILKRHQVGETVSVVLYTPAGGLKTFSIVLQRFPTADQVSYFIIPFVIGLVYLISSLYVFSVRRNDPASRAYSFFNTAAAISIAGLFEIFTTHHLEYIWTFSVALVGGALFNLAFLFPKELQIVRRYPFLRWGGYVPALGLALVTFTTLYKVSTPLAYVVAWRAEYIFVGLATVFFIAEIAYRRYTSDSPVTREQSRLILIGSIFSFGPLGVWLLVTSIWPTVLFTPYLWLPLGLFPVVVGYAILRYRLLNTDYLFNQAILYAILSVLAAATYAFLVTGLSLLLGSFLSPMHPLVIGLMVFILALLINPGRVRLQEAVDAVFFRGQVIYRQRLQTFGRELTQAVDLLAIVNLLRLYVQEGFLPAQLHIFVHDPLSDYYVATPEENKRLTTDIRFPANSALVSVLSEGRETIFLGEEGVLPDALRPERARLALLGAQLFVLLHGQQALIGWLALGPRRSGEPYTSRDVSYLEALSDQAALAVERAQVVADLERRVHEMNVLTRVAQGTNFTVAFDDILELIYAQTYQVIPVRDFRITLYDREVDYLYHVFYLENDERLSERENRPVPASMGLEMEVIISQRALVSDDYERECRSRGALNSAPDIYAWIGVPLNAGGRTFGILSLGSRDPAVTYTAEQRNLLQAIADQAAGAIVKARLLQESERRARQLVTLNEIGRGLTSTLELKPLLQKILVSATEIINCAAGSLFLIDQPTGELVFEVVLGPVAADLLGKRLPPGTGLVGQAVETRRAIIANDAKRRKEWFEKTDQQTGFDTQDMLVVPMLIQDRPIGVIEVINKIDGSPFNQSDQDLLTTFTSQATIAIENARLYTLTDQALAARVDELSVMQRIDRELNASLDVGRAMRITLDWAMSQSGADAGLVGVVEEGRVRLMTSQGYGPEITPYQVGTNGDARPIPAEIPALHNALESGQPQNVVFVDPQDHTLAGPNAPIHSMLKGTHSQAVVPIRREAVAIGILMLESKQADKFSDETLAFLSRLSDHAAIAIANAQLYAEVQAANMAKSKFVSFVAHELKNPMASIKGYTELVAGGMAGPINEMQAGFLNTVRSNVDRMNTIVSDLNDLTKIQVGSMRLDFKAVRVQDVLDEVIRSLHRQIEDKNLKLDQNIPGDLPMVWADELRLGQIVTNLVSNAVKYTLENGQILVGAERGSAGTEVPAGLEVVHVWVKDSGIGISREDQDKIFQQYFRTDISKEAASGTGLGLNITKSLIEMQGGRIWFESELKVGSIFHFTIPAAESA